MCKQYIDIRKKFFINYELYEKAKHEDRLTNKIFFIISKNKFID